MSDIRSIGELEALYGQPGETSLVKELDRLIPEYATFIEASPFVALATAEAGGLDCSPRGDLPGFVRVHDDRTLMLPDRRGNNRADSLRNVVEDGCVGLLFLVPGSGTTLRVNGRARLSADPALCASFAVDGQAPRTVAVIAIEAVYFQCARGHPPLRAVEPGEACRPAQPADARQDPGRHQQGAHRRRGLRRRVARAGEEVDVVTIPRLRARSRCGASARPSPRTGPGWTGP